MKASALIFLIPPQARATGREAAEGEAAAGGGKEAGVADPGVADRGAEVGGVAVGDVEDGGVAVEDRGVTVESVEDGGVAETGAAKDGEAEVGEAEGGVGAGEDFGVGWVSLNFATRSIWTQNTSKAKYNRHSNSRNLPNSCITLASPAAAKDEAGGAGRGFSLEYGEFMISSTVSSSLYSISRGCWA